ncbi:MAG TPA: nucleotidyl transferase AbiEii/AbiGii toxin family protein [Thermoanaerobaculia bacterium]|nr:nucleotidyl transferase AbiEii/AbiGii toxin family protein [Thermoanaerobaculia bacterium]
MRKTFDRRVVPDFVLDFVRACQERIPSHLGGGAALAGAYLGHRMTGDVDLFVHDAEGMRDLVGFLPGAAAGTGIKITLLRDVGHLVRARLHDREGNSVDVDVVHEPVADIAAPPPPIEEIVVESLADLRANKLTCILSRSEPRDLVDLYFLDQAGFPPEQDLDIALRKDAGVDPAVLAWLLAQFPTQPLPAMLVPLSSDQLQTFRDELAEKMRRMSTR